MVHFAINNMFALGCHEAGMGLANADLVICSSLSFPLPSGYWSREGKFNHLEQRIGEAKIDVTLQSMREAMNEEVLLWMYMNVMLVPILGKTIIGG